MEGFQTVQEKDASTEISDNLIYYSEDVLMTKFPHFSDGCKSLIRRIIWFTRDIKELRPMNKVVGDLQEVHTSGDSSIFEAVLRLGQPFVTGHPLIFIEGKYGEYYDTEGHAHSRYLEAKSSEFTQDIYFSGVNSAAFQMMPTKNSKGLEPKYLIPKVPMALVLGNLTVGYAFKSQIQMIDFQDVCRLVMSFASYYQNRGIGIPPAKTTAKYLLPAFPIRNLILNRRELLNSYAVGNYKTTIQIEGWADVSGNQIILRSLPYGVDFGKTVAKLRERFKDPKDWIRDVLDSANDYSSDDTEFAINLKHGKNPFEVLDRLRGSLKFDSKFYPFYNYVRHERIEELDPQVLTYYWYQERAANIATGLKYRQAQLIEKRMRNQAILLVVDQGDEVVKLVRNSDSIEDAIKAIYKKFDKLTLKQAGIVAKQPLTVWTRNSRKLLEEELEQIAADLETIVASFDRIDETIYNDASVLLHRYKSVSQTVYSDDFIGYVKFGNLGIINFFDYDHMREILLTKGWPSTLVKTVHLYDSKTPRKFILKQGKMVEVTCMTKEVNCEDVFCYPLSERNELTLVVGKDRSTSIVERLVNVTSESNYNLYPITKDFYAIHRDGKITSENYKNFTVRKTICSGAKTDIVVGLPNTLEDVVIFHMNSRDPNNLRVNRILQPNDLGQLRVIPMGEFFLLGVYSNKAKEFIINVPKQCTKNIRINHLIVKNIDKLFKGNTEAMLNLAKLKTEFKSIAKQDNKVSTMYTLNFGKDE